MLNNITKISKTYRHINRYREILSILIKYGFIDLLQKINLPKFIDIRELSVKYKAEQNLTRWERIRKVFEELGPAFIKFGQIMSSRPDMFPEELIVELEKLQDKAPCENPDSVKELIESELNKKVESVFKSFEKDPVASASIAQVHIAELHTGEKVVVKIQRPNLKRKLEIDAEIMTHLAALSEKYISGMSVVKPVEIIEEFSKTIFKEIDFLNEVNNIERFRNFFKDDTAIYVPKAFREYSSSKIITMEHIEGIKISQIEKIGETGLDVSVIAKRGADLFLKQIFQYGFFHADPHPGNIFIMLDGKICFLDYGMFGTLTKLQREQLSDIIIAITSNNEKKLIDAILSLSRKSKINYDSLSLDISDFVNKYFFVRLNEINAGKLLKEFLGIIIKHKITIPPSFYILIKSLMLIESVGTRLSPEFSLIVHIKPFVKKIYLERLSPLSIAKELYSALAGFSSGVRDFPADLKDLMIQLKNGETKFIFEHKGVEPVLKTFDNISNRIVFAIVLASIIIGSSLIVLSGIPPKWNEVPIIGIVGFLTAGLMGFWLLISILKHGKM
ncbi:MAG TPA: AarF/UbiB family protein [bacterium]|nr:AarF/UbiB family protein [bacterium]HPN32639.1 AarF/UbiB family protein [bacterium]